MTGIDSDSGGLRQPPTTPNNRKAALFGKYELGKLLGCGAFAKVYHARNLQSGQGAAIKVIDKKKMAPAMASNVKREVSVMRRLRHPHIVKLFEVLATKSKIYLVLEFAKGGELFARVAKGRFSEDLSRRYFRQLVSAVGFCHSRGVFHRDLKPENLLLDESGRLKVSDFGLSADVHQQREDALLRTLCGTPAYVAPEILAKKGYDGAKVDVWSCGVILFVLNAGFLPFNDPNLMVMYKKIYKGDFRCPKWMSSDLKRFLSRLLDTNPDTRITVDEILRDPWFRKGGGHEEATNFHRGEDDSKDEGTKKRREKNTPLNAFDIISFSSGLDLSGLFDASCNSAEGGERFVAAETPEAMMEKIQGLANSEESLRVRKEGESGFLLEGAKGEFQIGIEVFRLTEGLVVVEVKRRTGDAGSFNEAWKNRLRPQLTGA